MMISALKQHWFKLDTFALIKDGKTGSYLSGREGFGLMSSRVDASLGAGAAGEVRSSAHSVGHDKVALAVTKALSGQAKLRL